MHGRRFWVKNNTIVDCLKAEARVWKMSNDQGGSRRQIWMPTSSVLMLLFVQTISKKFWNLGQKRCFPFGLFIAKTDDQCNKLLSNRRQIAKSCSSKTTRAPETDWMATTHSHSSQGKLIEQWIQKYKLNLSTLSQHVSDLIPSYFRLFETLKRH